MHTLSVDCGGTGLKALVLDPDAQPTSERVRVPTPYPCPPAVFVESLLGLARATGQPFDRVTVGMPGAVRGGVVLATPHYVTESGPFTPRRKDLVRAWGHLDIRAQLQEAFDRPTLVFNDAELAGLAVISGRGYEVMLTLGTGMGFAHFLDGAPLPKIELSHAPFRKGETFDEHLGNHARKQVGNAKWAKRVARAIDALRPVLWWDACFLGGGGTKHLRRTPAADVLVVPNLKGLLGGVRVWDLAAPASAGSPATG